MLSTIQLAHNLLAAEAAPRNPLLPDTAELVWGSLAFFVVLALLSWKLVPIIQKGMADRTAKIEGDLAAAEGARASADKALADYKAQIADAKAEGNRIIDEARQQAEVVRKDLLIRAESDAAAIRAKANEDLNLQSDKLKADLSSHVRTLSLDLAEKVVGANMNRETNSQLVDRYIAELGTK